MNTVVDAFVNTRLEIPLSRIFIMYLCTETWYRQKRNRGSILLKVIGISNQVYFEVTDTGAGLNGYTMPDLFKKGIGLQNTRQRLLKLFDEDIHISANLPKGTKVHFSIPYCNTL